MRRIAPLALLLALSCSPPEPSDPSGFAQGPTGEFPLDGTTSGGSSGLGTSGAGLSTSAGSSEEASAGTGTAAGSTGEEIPPDFGPPGPAGCLGKIDFLFVISSSKTMSSIQTRLLEAYPGFMSTIKAKFPDFDTQIMVVDVDDSWYIGDCSQCDEDCDPQGELPWCSAKLDECDRTLGARLTFPSGANSSNRRCELANGRFITRDDPDPLGAFQCIAKVGTAGGGGIPAQVMELALAGPMNASGGCNEGFLREDALLVVTLIEDTEDSNSPGPAEKWVSTLTETKQGDQDAFVVLVLSTDCDEWNRLCDVPMCWELRLRELTELVPHGLYGSICAQSYVPFFEQALEEIQTACDVFVPQ